MGHATPGSPSQYSLAVILTTNIDLDISNTWRDDVARAPNVEDGVLDAADIHRAAAKETLIPIVLGHEVGHCLNIHANCNHLNCIMNYNLSPAFFSDGSFLLIEKEKNPEFEKLKNDPNFNLNHPKFKTTPEIRYKRDTEGNWITSKVPKLSNAHILNLAVTGQPGSHNNVEDCYFEISFVNTADQSSSSSSSYSLVSSDGVYTASTGDSHTANLSAPSGWTSIYWYLKSPSESGLGTSQSSVSDSTGNSTTASYTYMFPSGTSGDYVLTAYTTLSDNTVVQPSYTVSVSMSINVLSTPGATLACDITPPVPRDTGFTVTLTAVGPFRSASFYQQGPGSDSETFSGSEGFYGYPESGTTITHQLSFSGSQGAWNVRVEITPVTGNAYSVTFTIPTR